MESFLFKKGRGESNSIFSKRNWKKRWFVLDGGYLTYYETFDTNTNVPVNKKGVAPVIGCEAIKKFRIYLIVISIYKKNKNCVYYF